MTSCGVRFAGNCGCEVGWKGELEMVKSEIIGCRKGISVMSDGSAKVTGCKINSNFSKALFGLGAKLGGKLVATDCTVEAPTAVACKEKATCRVFGCTIQCQIAFDASTSALILWNDKTKTTGLKVGDNFTVKLENENGRVELISL